MKALGERRRWFNDKRVADELRTTPAIRTLADRLVREALGANVSREDVAAAPVMAAWAVFSRKKLTAPTRAPVPA